MAAFCFAMCASAGITAYAAPAQMTFRFERPGMDVPEYTLVLREDGSGTYSATEMQPRGAQPYVQQNPASAQNHYSTEYTLPTTLAARLFVQVRGSHLNADCASHAKNIANTGKKTLTLTGPAGKQTCAFNYTQNKAITSISDSFAGMSYTLEAGRRMARDEQYDRLGLDQEMNALVAALKDGRAEAPGLIATELRSLVNNDQVLERVRRNASMLLDKAALSH